MIMLKVFHNDGGLIVDTHGFNLFNNEERAPGKNKAELVCAQTS